MYVFDPHTGVGTSGSTGSSSGGGGECECEQFLLTASSAPASPDGNGTETGAKPKPKQHAATELAYSEAERCVYITHTYAARAHLGEAGSCTVARITLPPQCFPPLVAAL